MRLSRISLLILLLLSGCATLLPSQSAEVNRQLGQAVDAINELDAAVAIPQADHSFRGLQPYYVTAIAGLQSAKKTADQRALYAQGKLYERPAKISAQTVDNCIASLNLLMQLNVTKSLDPRDLEAVPVKSTCTIPRLIEGDLNRETGNE